MRAGSSALAVVAAAVVLAGCASGPKRAPLYEWGQYPTILHEDLKQALPPEQQLKAMEQQRALMQKAGTPMPPGMAMHMALLHQRLGQHDQAQQYLELEAQRYPSLRAFVTWLQKQQAQQAQQAKGGKSDEKS